MRGLKDDFKIFDLRQILAGLARKMEIQIKISDDRTLWNTDKQGMGRGSGERDRKVVAREVEKESEDYGAMEVQEGKTFGGLGLLIFSQNRTP